MALNRNHWKSDARHWQSHRQHWTACRPYPGGVLSGRRRSSTLRRSPVWDFVAVAIFLGIAVLVQLL